MAASVATIRHRLTTLAPSFARDSGFVRSLRQGMLYGAILFILLFLWLLARADDTAQKLQSSIPFKTAVLEVPEVIAHTDAAPNAPDGKLSEGKNINALVPAPIEGLSENKDGRALPVARVQDDLTPFQAYKRPFSPIAGKRQVSIVVVDFGLSASMAQSMLDNLPPEISLVLSSYSADPSKWAAAARAYGHEFWMALPMQTEDFGDSDTGPYTLLLNAPESENEARLFNILSSAAGYAGIVSEKNHVLSGADFDPKPVVSQIFGRGLAFAESTTDAPAFGLAAAMEFGFPYVQNNFWLDEDLRPEAIDAALKKLEIQASYKGHAVAFVHPYPLAINKVQAWIKEADQKDIQIAPLSALVQ